MAWNPDMNRNTVDEIEDLSYPPTGGRLKIIVLGILLPMLLAWFASKAWIDQVTTWPGNRGHGIIVKGDTARAIAVCKLASALFCHFRWFWGIVSSYRVFTVGMVVSLVLFLGGLGAAFWFAFG